MEGEKVNKKTVQIRSPSMNEYLTFSFDNDTTILKLKQLIQEGHPQRPIPDDQRIIYGGKVQSDTERLETILEKSSNDTIPIFHLVVKPSLSNTTQDTPTPTQTPATSASTLSTNPIDTTFTQNINSIPQQQQQNTNPLFNNTVPFTNNFIPSLSATPLVHGGYQIVALNGQYYLAPILVPNNNNNTINNPTLSTPNASTPLSEYENQRIAAMMRASTLARATATTTVPLNMNRQPQPQQQQQPQMNGNPRVIARPRAMARNASIWLALKLIFVLLVTCQGASIERVIIFHIMAIIFFMYQTGRFRLVIRRVTLAELQGQLPPGFNLPRELQQQFQQQPQPQPQPQPQQQQEQNQAPPTYTQATGTPSSPSTNGNNSDNGTNQDNSTPLAHQEHSTPTNVPSTTSTTQEQSSVQEINAHNTRLSVLKRGAYTFVASLWPNYGRDPQLAQAFENDDNEMAEL